MRRSYASGETARCEETDTASDHTAVQRKGGRDFSRPPRGNRSCSRLRELPACAVVPGQVLVRILALLRRVRDAAVGAVVLDLAAGPERDDAEQHDLGELRRVLERARDLRLAFDRFDEVHLVL